MGKLQVKELYAESVDGSFSYGVRKSLASKHMVPSTAENVKGYLIENQLIVELFKSFFRSLVGEID